MPTFYVKIANPEPKEKEMLDPLDFFKTKKKATKKREIKKVKPLEEVVESVQIIEKEVTNNAGSTHSASGTNPTTSRVENSERSGSESGSESPPEGHGEKEEGTEKGKQEQSQKTVTTE